MKILEIISEPDGKLSHTRIQSLGAFIVLSAIFVVHVVRHMLFVELLLAYGGLFVLGRVVNKALDHKKGDA